MIYNTCVRCRARGQINCKTYSGKHPEQTKEYYEAHNKERKQYDNKYREKAADKLQEYERARNQLNIYCPHCNREIITRKLNSHLQSQKCKNESHPNDDYIMISGRVYVKGESPLEGVWHRDHIPFEVEHYIIFENNVPRTVKVTTRLN